MVKNKLLKQAEGHYRLSTNSLIGSIHLTFRAPNLITYICQKEMCQLQKNGLSVLCTEFVSGLHEFRQK